MEGREGEETLLSTSHHTSISIYNMLVNGKMGFELSNFELSKVFLEPNPYLTQGIPVCCILYTIIFYKSPVPLHG